MAQLGTVKVQAGSGRVSVPVYDIGDSGSNVYEILRVQTDQGTGFIPLTDPNDATYNYLRVQTQNQGVLAVHNSASTVDVNEITTNVRTFSDTSVTLTVYEDIDGDGSQDNTETITLSDGTNTYSLSNFNGRGQDYWLRWELDTNGVNTETPVVNSAQLKDVGSWNSGSDWDNATENTRTVHESTANTDYSDTSELKKGYSPSNPLYSSDLAAYWPLHENSGGTAYDMVGSNNGTVYGASQGQQGLNGTTCYEFNNDRVNVSTPTDFSNDYTLSWWMYPTDFSGNPWPAGWNSNNNQPNTQLNNNGNNKLRFFDGENNFDSSLTFTTNTWYHVACVCDRNNRSYIYIDGSLDNSVNNNGGNYLSDNWYNSIGNRNDGSKAFYGKIWDYRVYSTALSSSQVQNIVDVVYGKGYLTTQRKSP